MQYTSGTNNDHFDYASATGVLTVATGTTIATVTASSYTLTLTATPGGTISSDPGTATLTVNVQSTCDGSTTVASSVKSTTEAGGDSGAIHVTVELGIFFLALMLSLLI